MENPKKKIIISDEYGNVIREGHYRQSDQYVSKYNLPLELRPADIIQLLSLLTVAIIFVTTTQMRLDHFEKSITYLSEFAESSDNYHAAISSTPFKGGAPINFTNIKFRNSGNFKDGDSAP